MEAYRNGNTCHDLQHSYVREEANTRDYFKILRLIRRVMTPFMEIKDLKRETGHAAVASDALSVRWS